MSHLDDLRAAVQARKAAVAADQATVKELRDELATATGHEAATLHARIAAAGHRLATDQAALAAAQSQLDQFLADPLTGVDGDVPIVLLPVRVETRFVTDAGAVMLLVRVYPDDIVVDDHREALTDAEVSAATAYWDRVWRSGRSDTDAHRQAFIALAGQVGAHRALWVARATAPDDTGRPDQPVPDGVSLSPPPVLATVAHVSDQVLEGATASVMPDHWTVLAFRGGTRIQRVDGLPVHSPLQVGPSHAGAAGADPSKPALEEGMQWLADFAAAEAAGMGIRVPLPDGDGVDRLVVVGVRASDDPAASAERLTKLFDGQRYTGGLGFLPVGTPTNNSDGGRSAFTRFADPGELFDADGQSAPPGAPAQVAANALGIDVDALQGIHGAATGNAADAGAMHTALWPATGGYFAETLLAPAVDDATVDAARELFIDHVRGLGPLPTLRVGRQPYGLLPAISLARWRPGSSDGAAHSALVGVLRRLAPEWLATTAAGAARAVPHIGRAGADPDQELLNILARDAQSGSFRLRPTRGGVFSAALTPLVGNLDPAGTTLADAATRLVGTAAAPVRLAGFQWETRTRLIRPAAVIGVALSDTDPLPPGTAAGDNYLHYLATRGERTSPYTGPGANSLLFRLALHACALADAEAGIRLTGQLDMVSAKAALEPDIVDTATVTMPRMLEQPAHDLVAAVPAGQTVADFVATATPASLHGLGVTVDNGFWRSSEVRSALGALSGRVTALLDRLTRETLDICSHRLDAWITAYAHRRLAEVRAARPAGLLIGGYGWVEDLRPKSPGTPVAALPDGEAGPLVSAPDDAGYVAAPSLTHAVSAALLLSAHLSHRGADGAAAQAFAVDLSSDRARLASWLLDGIRQGQPLGALLGYRFERGLHDRSGAGVELDRFIRPLRALAPLVAGATEDIPATVDAVESVAPSSVVDGLALLARFRADAQVVEPALVDASPDEHGAVLAELNALDAAADALSDLLLAETAYQLAAGNTVRAAGTLDAVGCGAMVPAEPEVLRAPRGGHAVTHRLISLVPADGHLPSSWAAGAQRPRRVAEPRLDNWAATLFGPADRIRAVVRTIGADGTVTAQTDITVAELGLCASDLIYEPSGGVEAMAIAHVAAGGAIPADGHAEIVHDDDPQWPGTDWPTDVASLDDALAQARWLADSVGGAQALTAIDLAPPGVVTDAGADLDELSARLSTVQGTYQHTVEDLSTALDASPPAEVAIRSALGALADTGLPGARDSSTATGQELIAQASELRGKAELALAAARVHGTDLDGLLAAMKALLGEAFTAVPLIGQPPQAWLDGLAAAQQHEFLLHDPAAPMAWLQRVAPSRGALARHLSATSSAGRYSAVQMPPASAWTALPGDHQPPAGNATSVVVHTVSEPSGTAPLAGLLIDHWSDVVPAGTATAGVTFRFDEPSARAPQTVLLAVAPDVAEPWTFDALADTVTETADLARIRMVGPEEVPWLGRYLPALYVADNAAGDTLTVDLHDLVVNAAVGPQ